MKLKFMLLLLVLSFKPTAVFSQWKNNEWMWGTLPNDTTWVYRGMTHFVFDNNSETHYKDSGNQVFIRGTFSGLRTPNNEHFVYTNGYTLANKNHDTLMNGSGLSPGGTYNTWAWAGYPVPAGAVLLPYPGSSNLMAMVHMDNFATSSYHAQNIYYSLIDPSGNNGQGLVMIKNQLVAYDTFNVAALMVNRHANGRDWWILVKRNYLNDFFTFLLTPTGIELKQIQSMGGPISQFGGQGAFSPDGKTLAGFNNGYQLRIYDFDRCTGLLSNMRYKYIVNLTAGGLSFSPNSRFLYISYYEKLWQFDLQASDVLNTQTLIATLDTTFHDPATGWYPSWAYHYLAADGKIYVQNFSGVMLCVINNPDMPGQACNFVQNQIQGPTIYYATVPTYVNLNLMQVHGSVCDTLGVGNEKLIIKNEKLKIAPNPSNGNINIEFPVQEISGMLYVYDVNGKQVYSEYVSPHTYIKNINLQGKLSSGMYALSMVFGEQRFFGKMVVE
jgi:hypothetical protein